MINNIDMYQFWIKRFLTKPHYAGCELSTGQWTNASEILIGPVKNCAFLVKSIDYSGKLPSGPVGKNAKFAAWPLHFLNYEW